MIWDLALEARLVLWRNFRKTLEGGSLIDIGMATAQWWADIPMLEKNKNPLSPWATDTWPDPWNLLINGPLDHTKTSVAIAYSLWMTVKPEEKSRITLVIVNSLEKRQILLAVVIDSKWLINYTSGTLVDKSQLDGKVELLATHVYDTFKTRIKA